MNLTPLNQWLTWDLTAISYLQPSALSNRENQARVQGLFSLLLCLAQHEAPRQILFVSDGSQLLFLFCSVMALQNFEVWGNNIEAI